MNLGYLLLCFISADTAYLLGGLVLLMPTCKIVSCCAGVLGVRRFCGPGVMLYSDNNACDAPLVLPPSSAICLAASLAWPSLTTCQQKGETNTIWKWMFWVSIKMWVCYKFNTGLPSHQPLPHDHTSFLVACRSPEIPDAIQLMMSLKIDCILQASSYKSRHDLQPFHILHTCFVVSCLKYAILLELTSCLILKLERVSKHHNTNSKVN